MISTCVIVSDGGRARFFTLARPEVDGLDAGPELVEKEDLVNPEAELMGKEVFTNMKSGRNRAQGGAAHGYDDHRTQWAENIERRFAKRVAGKLAHFVTQYGSERVLLVAEPRFLGLLRQARPRELSNAHVVEIDEDLSVHPPNEIHDALVRHKMLPRRRLPSTVYRPRGQPPPR